MSDYPHTTLSVPVKGGTSTKRVGPKPGSRSKKMTHVLESVYISLQDCSTLGSLLEYVQGMARDYGADARVEIYVETDHLTQYIQWWREMTEEEVALYKQQAKDSIVRRQQDKERDDAAALVRLRKERPDWLTEEMRG